MGYKAERAAGDNLAAFTDLETRVERLIAEGQAVALALPQLRDASPEGEHREEVQTLIERLRQSFTENAKILG